MRSFITALALALPAVQAFPAAVFDSAIENFERSAEAKPVVKRQTPVSIPPFNAQQQYVSNKGKYAFNPPSGTDQRGPCPGLNAMANHGYFPHNGVGNMADFVQGTGNAFGMGADLAEFLAAYGAIFDGNLTAYSIGGPYPGLTNGLGLLGEPEGLSGSHNNYEGDVSPVRGDLYQYGNDYKNQVKQFQELYELGVQNGGAIDLNVLTNYRVTRFNQSINENPYFFNAPFSGVIASPAAWSFIYRFMANKSAEYPEGRLDLNTLKSFYSMTGDYPNFKYTPGYEKFPDNWYKRNIVDYYTIPYFASDAVPMAIAHTQFAAIGGNTGKTNSFVGIDPANLTGGVYNSKNLFQGNNVLCYGLEVAAQQAPDILSGLYTDINPAMDAIGTAVNSFLNGLGCPKLNNINKEQFQQYPGYTKLNQKTGSYSS